MSEWKTSVTRQDLDNEACVVFIHGFQGDPAATWDGFPTLLAADPAMGGWDVVSFGYESDLAPDMTGIWDGDPTIGTIADSLATFARTGEIARYGAIVFIAHSMGGLAVQRSLLDHADLAERTDKVILFGTPSFGLAKAWLFQLPVLRLLNRQVRDMGRTSEFIRSLRSDWARDYGQTRPFGFLAVAGSEDEFVPRSASIDGFSDDQCEVVPGNHLELVKPAKSGDASLRVAVDFIRGQESPGRRWGSAALAVERCEFQRVVDQLGPHRGRLDHRALVDLALALEGLGRRTEAMAVLAEAKRHDTDAMGVLAGRHKRNWLQDRVQQEALLAIGLYREGYELAALIGDAAQAFYHGINLAFFSLVFSEDSGAARGMADRVLSHCAKAAEDELPADTMWRLATQAEAQLILGNADAALHGYEETFTGSPKPKPWQFASTARQALRIADELGDEQLARDLLDVLAGHAS